MSPRLIIALVVAFSTRAFAVALAPEAVDFFEQKIRPVLVSECYECHCAQKTKGGLRVDFRDGLLKGGDTGAAVVPRDVVKSLLLTAIKHLDPDMKMPDKSPKLDDAIIADFEKWIAMGAPDPRDEPPREPVGKPSWEQTLAVRKLWWSLRPVAKPTVPEVKNSAWSQHPVDRFLLAKMEEHKLAPAHGADPRTLIRRLTFTLTGLPPTPDEVEKFVGESIRDPQSAIRNAADRLLASPRFGEHWARHWMDLFRYADTHGSEGDPAIPEAWRYRDYLIRAHNADVPLDQMICEHLAGDLLAHPRMNPAGFNESILGTAQLRMVEHGFQPVDTLDDQVKAVDNQIDVVSKAFQALTVSCARCHDHKFDAISQRDYYALFGVFASCRPAQVTIDAPEVLAKNRDALAQKKAEIKSALAEEWIKAAAKFGERLKAEPERLAKAQIAAAQIHELEQKIADIDFSARKKLTGENAPPLPATVAPIALWNFEKDARDQIGSLHGRLEGGAEIKDGRLVLNGKSAFMRTETLPRTLREKTLEAWVVPENLDQRAGGVLTVEMTKTHGFDAIVFAEKEPRRWLAGSNNFARTVSVDGPDETAKPGELVHLAVVYRADNSIALYRNGEPYGAPYARGEMKSFDAGDARVLIGLRHTGAGNGFFAGEIKEARLYDRALNDEEIAASFRAGTPPVLSAEQIAAALTPQQRDERAVLMKQVGQLRAKPAEKNEDSDALQIALREAKENPANPLAAWVRLASAGDSDFAEAWKKFAQEQRAKFDGSREYNSAEKFKAAWDFTRGDYAKWFPYGNGLPQHALAAGEFSIEPDGEKILDGIFPAGAITNRFSSKHSGLLTSPRFKIGTDSISVRAWGGGGAMVRVIVDNYPLPTNPIFPKAILEKSEPGWVRLDTAYRKGSWAYIEFGTHDDLTRPLSEKKKSKAEKMESKETDDGRSWFGVEKIVFHDEKNAPREEDAASLVLLDFFERKQTKETEAAKNHAPENAKELGDAYARVLAGAVAAWREERLTEPQRALLDFFVRHELLPVTLAELEKVKPLVAEYRRLESEVPVPQRAPGVLEADSRDAPLLPRGDHTKPGDLVPRAYLGVFGGGAFHSAQSGRLELAAAITDPRNPLTARVMVNRIWHWLFGRGIVPTVDNFGRLGEKPTHPELLDFLATHFVENGWSEKEMIRFLVTTRAFQMSSEASPQARETDPANDWLSHFRLRRIEAESVRDSLLAVSGKLDATMFGPDIGENTPRRSVYLSVRRTNLNPFLAVFDAPKPFSTLGRRDVTNVPAQSLTMLNSKFVIEQARVWAQSVMREKSDAESRVHLMFVQAFAREPSNDELSESIAFLNDLAREQNIDTGNLLVNEQVWQDFAQSLFNLKEFIYLR